MSVCIYVYTVASGNVYVIVIFAAIVNAAKHICVKYRDIVRSANLHNGSLVGTVPLARSYRARE